MIHENVKRVLKKNNEFTILTNNGTLLRLENPEEEGLFNLVKDLDELPSDFMDNDMIKKLVGMRILKFRNYKDTGFSYPEYDLRLIDYEGTRPLYHAPIMAHLAIESACNMNCIYCSVRKSHRKQGKVLSVEEWKRVIDKLDKWGVGQITLTGGEPLLRIGNVIELLNYAKNKSPAVSLSTNGLLVDEKTARMLCEAGLKLCQLSLDSHVEDINSYLRGRGVRDKVLNAVRILQRNGVTVGIDCVVSKKTIDKIPEFIEFLDRMGVPFLTLLKLKPGDLSDEDFKNLSPTFEEYSDLLRKVASMQEKTKIKITVDCGSVCNMQDAFSRKEMKTVPVMGCPLGHAQIVINPNGDVYPCAALLDEEFKLGNALEDDLEKIWYENKKLQNLRLVKTNVKGKCKACPGLDICRGGCRGISKRVFNDVWREDPSCRFSSI